MARKSLFPILLLSLAVITLAGAAAGQDRFGYLSRHLDTYPDDAFFAVLETRHHLKALVGHDYARFRKNFAVVTPTEFMDGHVVAMGCMAHNCVREKAIVAVNYDTGKVTAGLMTDCRKITIYSQDASQLEHLPAAVQKWVAFCRRGCGQNITPLIVRR
jgi:hypothetical protein